MIINRIFPAGVDAAYFEAWKQAQQHYIKEAMDYFSDVPVWKVNLFAEEIVGELGLRRLADTLYSELNPADRFSKERPYQFRKTGDTYQLSIRLPFLSKDEIGLTKHGDELIVTVGGFKQHVALPRTLSNKKTTGAKLTEDQLVIKFEDEN